MSDELRKLIAAHDFLNEAIKSHGPELGLSSAVELSSRRDETFLKLLKFVSDDPRVSLAQIECLVSSLASLAPEPEQAAFLRGACIEIATRLTAQVNANASILELCEGPRVVHHHAPQEAMALSSQFGVMLNSLSDRAAVFDLNYRYAFINQANADFHQASQLDFMGRPCWHLVGDDAFERLTKPSLDQCFAGKSASFFASHRRGRTWVTYSVVFDPIRDADGNIHSAVAIARDVSKISPPSKVVWSGPRKKA